MLNACLFAMLRSIAFGFLLANLTSCCDRSIINPRRPPAAGWVETRFQGVTVKGQFVLNKNETTENGQVGIRLLDIGEAKCEIFRITRVPSATLQFYRVANKSVVCEVVLPWGTSRIDQGNCGNKLDWDVVAISAINASEGWVAFDLR